jgi:tetratricopeptide (TPR) repeat protein
MFRSIVVLVGGLASLSVVSLFAQDAVLAQQYGSGVHAYFTGDMQQAYERLTAAAQAGSKDPRVFYFRGLTYLQLGRPQEAATDFRKGAELESKDINRFYNVGKALERVQGSARLQLEAYRVDARMAALEQEERIRKARYEAMKREEERVVSEQSVTAPELPPGAPEAAAPADSENPFAAPEATEHPAKKGAAAKPAAKKGAEASPAAEENPFDSPAKPSDKAAEKGGAATKPDAKKPAADKKPGDEEDPFGGSDAKKAEKKSDAKKGSDAAKPSKSPDKEPDPFGN